MDVTISFLDQTDNTIIIAEVDSYPMEYCPVIWENVNPNEIVSIIFDGMDPKSINLVLSDLHDGINLHEIIIDNSIKVYDGYIVITNKWVKYISSDVNVCILETTFDGLVQYDWPNRVDYSGLII